MIFKCSFWLAASRAASQSEATLENHSWSRFYRRIALVALTPDVPASLLPAECTTPPKVRLIVLKSGSITPNIYVVLPWYLAVRTSNIALVADGWNQDLEEDYCKPALIDKKNCASIDR